MNQALIDNWNAKVHKKETIFCLGDFAFVNSKDQLKHLLSQLNGHKVLVKGNHDRDNKTMLEAGFDRVIENEVVNIGGENVYLSHYPFHPVTQYVSIGDRRFMKMDKGVDGRYLHKRILDDGKSWLLHGHVHTAWKVNGRMINVGADVWNYAPVSHEKLLRIIRGQDVE
jgi:calcineurin-like phosphoesterase family protein